MGRTEVARAVSLVLEGKPTPSLSDVKVADGGSGSVDSYERIPNPEEMSPYGKECSVDGRASDPASKRHGKNDDAIGQGVPEIPVIQPVRLIG